MVRSICSRSPTRSADNFAASSDGDINSVSGLFDRHANQLGRGPPRMHSGLDVVFESVPRADDVEARLVESEATAFAARLDHFGDARNDFALADGPALMRAGIFPGIELAIDAENSDRFVANV